MTVAKTRVKAPKALAAASTVGERVARLRGNDKTQSAFAAELTVARQSLGITGKGGVDVQIDPKRVGEWENEKVGLTYDVLRMYQTATHASLDWIVLGVGPDGEESAEPVYLGRRWPETTLHAEIASYAKQRLTARIAAGDFDDLTGTSVEHGPARAQARSLAAGVIPSVASLLAHLERAALADARSTVWHQLWHQHMAKAWERTNFVIANRPNYLRHQLRQERLACIALHRSGSDGRAAAEWSHAIQTASDRRQQAAIVKHEQEFAAKGRREIREWERWADADKAKHPERYLEPRARKTKPPRQRKPAGR